LDLIKVIASQRSVIAAASVVQRINVVFGDANQATKSPQVGLAAYVYPMFQKVRH
jgi:exportin-5